MSKSGEFIAQHFYSLISDHKALELLVVLKANIHTDIFFPDGGCQEQRRSGDNADGDLNKRSFIINFDRKVAVHVKSNVTNKAFASCLCVLNKIMMTKVTMQTVLQMES